MVDSSDPLSCEVGLELDNDDENILFALTNFFDGFSYSESTNITENFNIKSDKHDNDCVMNDNFKMKS